MGWGAVTGPTFLFTDVEGSTRLWESAPSLMREDLAEHDALLGRVIATNGGQVFKSLGDGVAAVFARPVDAVVAAVESQRALMAASWRSGPVRVRMGLHCGEAEPRDGDWFGPTINRTARLHAVAHGGQIVVTGTLAALVEGELPRGIALVDLGEHRLRDLIEPERIHQVTAPGLPDRFRPLRTEHHPGGGVPAPAGKLLGRAGERRRLAELVHGHRIVTITGPPGAGKTRLAIELAREDRARWPGGTWFCSLTSLTPGASGAAGVAGALADLLGAAAVDGASAVESVVGALADRRALVVLDGCDHVIADAAEVADALRTGCPGTAVLATSRERLAVADEHLLDLPTLDEDTAVALFTARATAVRARFSLAEHEDAVRGLVRRLDGLPLAIELAAARVRTHAPAEIDRMVAAQAQVLRRPQRRGAPVDATGHHDLDAAIAWSHDLLEDREQRVFRQLAVFAGSFDADDVAAVLPELSALEATDVLDALVDRSLLTVAPPRSNDRASSYRLLGTLRAYARHRLDEHPGEDPWARWAEVLVQRLEVAAPRLLGPDEARWVGDIAELWEDLRTVHARACAQGDAALAVRLVAPLLHHSTMRGLEVGEWAERAIALPGAWDRPQAPLVASLAAEARMRRGDTQGAAELGAAALDAAGDGGPWLAHSTLCLAAFVSGDLAAGAKHLRRLDAAAGAVRDEEPLAVAVAAFVNATVMGYGGVPELVDPALVVLADVSASTRCPSVEAMARLAEGRTRIADDPAGARDLLRHALDLATSVDNVLIATQARWALAELSAADDPAGALADLGALLHELRGGGDAAQQQQALLRSLGPLVSLDADEPALLVASVLDRTVWGNAAQYRAAQQRLAGRTTPEAQDEAADRARALGVAGVADAVVAAIDGLGRAAPANRG